jgi:hypothetical protein
MKLVHYHYAIEPAGISITMNIPKRSDIVPVLYLGGSGGAFVSSFLYHAREKSNYWVLSENGNAHATKRDAGTLHRGPRARPIDHINTICQLPVTDVVKYIPTHCSDPDLALLYFDKIIKIYNTESDQHDIALAFISKWGADDHQLPPAQLKLMVKSAMTSYTDFPALCNKYRELDSVLNISWQEIMHDDPAVLVHKLSEFTGLPSADFPQEQLLTWRGLTRQAIEKYRSLLLT